MNRFKLQNRIFSSGDKETKEIRKKKEKAKNSQGTTEFQKKMVLEGRLELPRIAPLAPQASASAIPPPEHLPCISGK